MHARPLPLTPHALAAALLCAAPAAAQVLAPTPDWSFEPDSAGAQLGWSCAGIGDVNGDGYADVALGAWEESTGFSYGGRVYVFHGSPGGFASIADWTHVGSGGHFGRSVAGGDFNGDGYADLVVGADLDYETGPFGGRAFVFLGSASGLEPNPVWIGESDNLYAQYGLSVSSAGDVDGDGDDEVLIGAYHWWDRDVVDYATGRAYVYLGTPTGPEAAPVWVQDSDVESTAQFGWSVACAGDVNGDGLDDIAIGSRAYGDGEYAEGAVFVYHGTPSGPDDAISWSWQSDNVFAQTGQSVSSAGDVDGDGFSDLVVASWKYSVGKNGGATQEGAAHFFRGTATGLEATPAWTYEGDQTFARFNSVAGAGDVNLDGFDDVLVGIPSYDDGETDEGRALLFLGSPTGLAAAPDWLAHSDQADALLGWSVAGAGDIDGDGTGDVLIGARTWNGGEENEGRVLLFRGASVRSTAPGPLSTGGAPLYGPRTARPR